MGEVPSKKQSKVIYAFILASKRCKGTKGVVSGKYTKHALCVKEEMKKILKEIKDEDLDRIHEEITKKIHGEPSEINIAKALTRSLQ